MKKYSRIYILGSGFSKSASGKMPAMKQLTSMLKEEKNRGKYDSLIDYVNLLRERSNDCEELTSIESISSLVLGKSVFYNTTETLYFEYIKNQLHNWLFEAINISAPEIDQDKKVIVSDFIRKISLEDGTEGNTLVITFNYDLLIERLIHGMMADEICIDYIVKLNRYSDLDKCSVLNNISRFRYLKLHGSFNWFRSPGGINYNLNNIYLVEDSDIERELIHYNDIPVFIPMTTSKMIYKHGSFYNALWNIGERYLDLCDEINFIGYGFPVTDIDNLQFFLKYKKKIREIVVFEEDLLLKKRLEKIFESSSIINSDALEYIESLI